MKAWFAVSLAAIAFALLLIQPETATGQAPKAAYKASRTPDGKPDIQGYWFTQSGAAAWDVEEHPASQGIMAGPSIVIDPPNKKIPYQPWALTKRQDLIDHHAFDDPQAHCFASGVPRASYAPFGIQMLQSPGHVLMMYENFHLYRDITTDGRPHRPAVFKTYMGDSRGRWDGDTLVVDVANQNGKTWLDMASNFTTESLHVEERYTRVAEGTIAYEATLTDPAMYTQPWKIAFNMRRETRPNYELLELACAEGEQDLEHYTESQGGKNKTK